MEKRVSDSTNPERIPEPAVPEPEQPLLTDIADFLKDTKTILPLTMLGLFLLAFIAFLHFAKPFCMPIVFAVILSFLLKPVVNVLQNIRLPRWLGALIVIVAFVSLVSIVFSHLVQPAREWMEKGPENFQKIQQRVEHYIRPARKLGEQVQSITTTAPDKEPQPKVEVSKTDVAGAVVSYASSLITSLIEVIVLLYFLLVAGDMFAQKLVKVLATFRDKKRAVSIFHELQNNISVYLFTITIINVSLGALVGLGVMLLGMPNPLLWGSLAAILNFIPYFGPLTGVTILAIAGMTTFDSVGRGMIPPALYLGLHAIESNFITPMVLGRRLTLNPVVIFGSLIFWMWLWGIPGALIAVPLLMMIKIICDHFKPLA
ncbi:MAG: family transporter, partial [Verrucomicrobiales bacterium]|nr:family transporter [Verrucomicrobiales bacterium]